jgi:hypothetical protein
MRCELADDEEPAIKLMLSAMRRRERANKRRGVPRVLDHGVLDGIVRVLR